jgi:hypothetical protein
MAVAESIANDTRFQPVATVMVAETGVARRRCAPRAARRRLTTVAVASTKAVGPPMTSSVAIVASLYVNAVDLSAVRRLARSAFHVPFEVDVTSASISALALTN